MDNDDTAEVMWNVSTAFVQKSRREPEAKSMGSSSFRNEKWSCSHHIVTTSCIQIWKRMAIRNRVVQDGTRIYHQLTNYMEQSPSWEAKISSAMQGIPRAVWTRRFFTAFIRSRHLSVSCAKSIQSMPHSPKFYVFKIRFYIIYPFSPMSSKSTLPFVFPLPNPKCSPPLPSYVPHAPPITFFFIWSPE